MRKSERRFEIKSKLWNELNAGNKVIVKSKKGHFEYEFVTEIKPTANTVQN